MTNKEIREILREGAARLADGVNQDETALDRIDRYWMGVRREDLNALRAWLRAVGSAENTDEDGDLLDGKDGLSVVDGLLKGTQFYQAGTWYPGEIWWKWRVPGDGAGGPESGLALYQRWWRGSRTLTDGEARADQTSVTVKETHAQTAASATPAAGKIVRARNEPAEIGGFRTEVETVTPVAQDTGWVEYPDRYGKSYARAFRNQAAAPVDGFVEGHNNSLSVSPNEFGKIDGSGARVLPQSSSDNAPQGDDNLIWERPSRDGKYSVRVEVKWIHNKSLVSDFLNGSLSGYLSRMTYDGYETTAVWVGSVGKYKCQRVFIKAI